MQLLSGIRRNKGDQRQSGGGREQTITPKQIIGQCWVYNGYVKGLHFHNTMAFMPVHTCVYVHTPCVWGDIRASTCLWGVCKDGKRDETGRQMEEERSSTLLR